MTFFDYPSGAQQSGAAEQLRPFLPHASEREWSELLRLATVRRLAPGETLISPGPGSRSLFLVIEGQVEVLAPANRKWRHVATIGAGSVVGELAFFDGGERSALVRALTDVSASELTHESFGALRRTNPELAMALVLDVGRVLSQRMRLAQAAI
ncbi:MAG: cyclic nucleotide-binding domain-containing protein [Pseudonocardiales bacterium]